jgi:hypothetical protein
MAIRTAFPTARVADRSTGDRAAILEDRPGPTADT